MHLGSRLKFLFRFQSNTAEQVKSQDLPTVVYKLKEAALRLGESLPSKEKECSIIHIKGESTLFSCYDVGTDVSAI